MMCDAQVIGNGVCYVIINIIFNIVFNPVTNGTKR